MRTIEVKIHGDKSYARAVMLETWRNNVEKLLHQYPEETQKMILKSLQNGTE